jgi:hypothetical protein
MPDYLVNRNAQPTGEHEVHSYACKHLPLPERRQDLGWSSNSTGAMRKAKVYYSNIDGCVYCCSEIHTS